MFADFPTEKCPQTVLLESVDWHYPGRTDFDLQKRHRDLTFPKWFNVSWRYWISPWGGFGPCLFCFCLSPFSGCGGGARLRDPIPIRTVPCTHLYALPLLKPKTKLWEGCTGQSLGLPCQQTSLSFTHIPVLPSWQLLAHVAGLHQQCTTVEPQESWQQTSSSAPWTLVLPLTWRRKSLSLTSPGTAHLGSRFVLPHLPGC